jgi:copper chaperone CopZ
MAQTRECAVMAEEKMPCAACADCTQCISSTLRRLPGVQEVRASPATPQVLVMLDSSRVGAE